MIFVYSSLVLVSEAIELGRIGVTVSVLTHYGFGSSCFHSTRRPKFSP